MVTKYIIRKSDHHRTAFVIEALHEDGTPELLALTCYRVGARRIGEELKRLAPAVPLIDMTLAKGVRNVRQ